MWTRIKQKLSQHVFLGDADKYLVNAVKLVVVFKKICNQQRTVSVSLVLFPMKKPYFAVVFVLRPDIL